MGTFSAPGLERGLTGIYSYVCTSWVQEAFYGRELILADREMVEQKSDALLDGAAEEDIAFLVVGDPLRYHNYSKSPGVCLPCQK